LGKDTPWIMEGDGEADIQIDMIEMCGIKYEDFAENESILTKEIFEKHFYQILRLTNSDYLSLLIFGALILRTGSFLPNEVREKIVKAADWENEKERWKYADAEFIKFRKEILIDFRQKIINHKRGEITKIL